MAKETPRMAKKKKLGLISKKATLQVQLTCFVLFFPVVLHENNMKLPETSWLKVLWRKWRTCFLFTIFFSLPLIFTLVATSISQFLTAATKFLCCSVQQKTSPLFYLSLWLYVGLFLVELHWLVTYILLFSVFFFLRLYSKFVDMKQLI